MQIDTRYNVTTETIVTTQHSTVKIVCSGPTFKLSGTVSERDIFDLPTALEGAQNRHSAALAAMDEHMLMGASRFVGKHTRKAAAKPRK